MTKILALASVLLLPIDAFAGKHLQGRVEDFTLPNDVYCVVYKGPVNGNEYGPSYNSTPSVTMQCDFGRRKYANVDDPEETTSRGEGD